jgi:hypothetical protein
MEAALNPAARLIISFVLRLVLFFFAGWFAIAESALPPGVSMVSRIGLATLFLIVAILVGEVANMRMHLGMLLGALRAVGGGAGAASGVVSKLIGETEGTTSKAASADPRDSIDILIRALGSRDEDTRTKAHHHLQRLTGQSFGAAPADWESWWAGARESFKPGA